MKPESHMSLIFNRYVASPLLGSVSDVSVITKGDKIVARSATLPHYGHCAQCMICGEGLVRQGSIRLARQGVELHLFRKH